jgi:hypothetical protein
MMARQLFKGMTMLLMIMALAFVTAVASANAQSIANVPFEFVAGSKNLPAGQYYFSDSTAGGEIVRITAAKKDMSVFSMTVGLSSNRRVEESKLVFRRYGNRYFLAEIWTAGEHQGQKLLKSREEKAIERELASIHAKSEMAQRSERVEIALVKQ